MLTPQTKLRNPAAIVTTLLKVRSLLLIVAGSALLSVASAQTTLFSFDFEADTSDQKSAGWVEFNTPGGVVVGNSLGAGNTSSQLLQFPGGTGNSHLNSPGVNLSAYLGSHTLTFSFDYYQVGTTPNDTSLLIAFTDTDDESGNGFSWVGADSQIVGISGILFNLDPAGDASWQHFEFDVTSAITLYMNERNGTPNDFRVAFQNWVSGPAGGSQNIYLDNITLTATAIPEPSTYAALLGLGALGLVMWRRRARA